MSDEDWWSRWFRRRPFFRSNLGNVDEVFREMEEIMEREFKEI